MFRSSMKVRNRIYCVLFTALLTAANVFAEDDLADIDPNADSPIFAVFNNFWNFLAGLIA